jgi:hypothetical protein
LIGVVAGIGLGIYGAQQVVAFLSQFATHLTGMLLP